MSVRLTYGDSGPGWTAGGWHFGKSRQEGRGRGPKPRRETSCTGNRARTRATLSSASRCDRIGTGPWNRGSPGLGSSSSRPLAWREKGPTGVFCPAPPCPQPTDGQTEARAGRRDERHGSWKSPPKCPTHHHREGPTWLARPRPRERSEALGARRVKNTGARTSPTCSGRSWPPFPLPGLLPIPTHTRRPPRGEAPLLPPLTLLFPLRAGRAWRGGQGAGRPPSVHTSVHGVLSGYKRRAGSPTFENRLPPAQGGPLRRRKPVSAQPRGRFAVSSGSRRLPHVQSAKSRSPGRVTVQLGPTCGPSEESPPNQPASGSNKYAEQGLRPPPGGLGSKFRVPKRLTRHTRAFSANATNGVKTASVVAAGGARGAGSRQNQSNPRKLTPLCRDGGSGRKHLRLTFAFLRAELWQKGQPSPWRAPGLQKAFSPPGDSAPPCAGLRAPCWDFPSDAWVPVLPGRMVTVWLPPLSLCVLPAAPRPSGRPHEAEVTALPLGVVVRAPGAPRRGRRGPGPPC